MTLWNDMIIGLCLLLLLLLWWKESRRPNRLRLPARIVASTLAVISLACLALPLNYTVKTAAASSGKEGVLLTEGYDPDSLREFLQTARTRGKGAVDEIKVFSVADGFPATEVRMADGASNALAGIDRLSGLHVFGYGLTRRQWLSLHPPPLTFHPSPPAGILSVSWRQKAAPGEKCRIQGSIALVPGRQVKLLLTGMGIPLDSVVIGAGTPQGPSPDPHAGFPANFELSALPAQIGRSVYRLVVLAGSPSASRPASPPRTASDAQPTVPAIPAAPHTGHAGNTFMDTLEQASIPLEVLPGKKLKILLLAGSPDFENTFLVNWLSRNGHAVASRTVISKGKSDEAFLNMPAITLDPLTPSTLDKFDLVIADAAALQTGSSAEGSNLRRQVAEKGMGLIIKADSTAPAFYKDLFPLDALKDSTRRLYIKERPGTQALLRDSASRVLVSSGIYGAGKLVFSTLNTTYFRMLSGDKKEYAAYWSLVLRAAARNEEPGEDWQIRPDLPRVNEPLTATLQTNKSGLPQGQFASQSVDPAIAPDPSGSADPNPQTVYLAQDPWLPFCWQGTYWPVTPGWQSTATVQGKLFRWYAWSAGEWRNISRRQRWTATVGFIADQASADRKAADPTSPATDTRQVPTPPAWFYTLFLLSCLFLWVERKI